ncbi:iron-sulfur cluster assembly protein [Amycolatopsis pigmentata]|uniref:Iron-sulfur cluster assembly protein n=1 Tax=Amycolatopsis pigmentata TaxID=450801 RepID=A0ABW5FRJ8_9PSEU
MPEVMSLMTAAWDALSSVRDPELDEPITKLGFVHELAVDGPGVRARLRLPTYFCAPNFAYLMVADAVDALYSVPGVESVDVRLEDHFAAEEINAGVAMGAGFTEAFPGHAVDELGELRRTFLRKAHTASLERTCRLLLDQGRQVADLAEMVLSDVPDSPERDGLLRRRRELGLPAMPESPLFVDDEGRPVPRSEVASRLRFARAVRVSIDGNAGFCRGLLRTRYGKGGME